MSTAPVTSDSPVEVKLGDGSVVKGANLDEAFKNLATMKENASAAIKRTSDELEAERQRAAGLAAEVERLKHPQPVNDGKFNNSKYWELMNADPIAAQNYLDQARFGFESPDQVVPAFNQMRTQVDNMTQSSVAASFLAQHVDDFPANAEAAKVLNSRVTDLVSRSGFNFDVHTLNFAYNQLVDEGQIKPLEKNTAPDEIPNPSLGGTGSTSIPNEVTKADGMSDKDLEALLRSKGMIR